MSLMLKTVDFTRNEITKRKSFILYSIIGVSGASLDYVVFLLLLKYVPLHYVLLNVVSTTLGIVNNFIWNARLNFGVTDQWFTRFLRFYAVGLLGIAVGSVLLYLAVDCLLLSPAISKLIVIFVIVLLQYNLNKRVSFGKLADP